MELLVVLLLLVAINVALWRGWGTDTRDNENWDPSLRVHRSSAARTASTR